MAHNLSKSARISVYSLLVLSLFLFLSLSLFSSSPVTCASGGDTTMESYADFLKQKCRITSSKSTKRGFDGTRFIRYGGHYKLESDQVALPTLYLNICASNARHCSAAASSASDSDADKVELRHFMLTAENKDGAWKRECVPASQQVNEPEGLFPDVSLRWIDPANEHLGTVMTYSAPTASQYIDPLSPHSKRMAEIQFRCDEGVTGDHRFVFLGAGSHDNTTTQYRIEIYHADACIKDFNNGELSAAAVIVILIGSASALTICIVVVVALICLCGCVGLFACIRSAKSKSTNSINNRSNKYGSTGGDIAAAPTSTIDESLSSNGPVYGVPNAYQVTSSNFDNDNEQEPLI